MKIGIVLKIESEMVRFKQNVRLNNFCDVMTWRHNVITSYKWKTKFFNSVTYETMETKKNQLSSSSTSWDKWIKFSDVMTWHHDVTA